MKTIITLPENEQSVFAVVTTSGFEGRYLLVKDLRGSGPAPSSFTDNGSTPVTLTATIDDSFTPIDKPISMVCDPSKVVADDNGSLYFLWLEDSVFGEDLMIIEDKRAATSTVKILTLDGVQYVRSLKVSGTVASFTLNGETVSPDVLDAEVEGETLYSLSFTQFIKDNNGSVYYRLVGAVPVATWPPRG